LQTEKDLQLKIPKNIIITWKTVHTALNTLTPAETNLQAAAAPPPLSQKQEQTEPQSFEILNPVYNKIPNPTRQM